VPGGQWAVWGLGPGANDTAGGQVTMLGVSKLRYGASFTNETTKLNPTARRLKLAKCDRDVRTVVRPEP
jgi:hypothetical protein